MSHDPASPPTSGQPRPSQRLDKAPRPREGYPRAPEHEQLEEQLHRDAAAPASNDDAATSDADTGEGNEGEGNRTAARHYNEKATAAADDTAKVDALAEEAEKALDSSEADTLRNSELRGKLQQHR